MTTVYFSNKAVVVTRDRLTPLPVAILEHPTKARVYVYLCSCCEHAVTVYAPLECVPVLCCGCRQAAQ